MIVVDASLGVKWLIREPESAAATALLSRHSGGLAAPDIFFVEVAGAIVRRANEKALAAADARRLTQAWGQAYVERTVAGYPTTSARLLAAADFALMIGHPLKDCIYVTLARELDCELVTCDARLRDKAAPFYRRVTLLSDYSDSSSISA